MIRVAANTARGLLLLGMGLLSAGVFAGGCAEDTLEAPTGVRSAASTTSTLTCQQLTFEKGSLLSGQSAATLAVRQLTGTQDVWGSYVEFQAGASAVCTFPLGAVDPASISALSIRTNYRGPRLAEMRWVFEAWNATTSSWVLVGDNAFASDWTWSAATLSFPAGVSQFVSGGAIKVRYRAMSTYDASNVDEWVVVATTNALQPDASTADVASADVGPADVSVDVPSDQAADVKAEFGSDAKVDGSVDAAPIGTWWRPQVVTSWDWQLAVPISHAADVQVYDIEMFNNTAAEIAQLHAEGRKVICYVCMGSWEDWRPDANAFPASVKGATYAGFPNEKWLDIRQIGILGPIMRARLDMAKAKGCDGIEPDNIDGYDTTAHESSGFPLTYQDQMNYNRWIANEVHGRGMAVGLKNDIHQAADLVGDFDFVVSEQCFQYGECQFFVPFVNAGKPVFEAEYRLKLSQFCPQANAMNFNSIRKRNALNAYREACR